MLGRSLVLFLKNLSERTVRMSAQLRIQTASIFCVQTPRDTTAETQQMLPFKRLLSQMKPIKYSQTWESSQWLQDENPRKVRMVSSLQLHQSDEHTAACYTPPVEACHLLPTPRKCDLMTAYTCGSALLLAISCTGCILLSKPLKHIRTPQHTS